MPLYEYQCESCGERLERLQKLADPPLTECPACGEPRLRRLVSAPAFQFKGSGWYVTDYARKGGDAGAESGKGAASAQEGGSRETGHDAAKGKETGGGGGTSSSKPEAGSSG